MFLRRVLAASLVVALLPFGSAESDAAKRRDPCVSALPTSLEKVINQHHPNWKIVTLESLGGYEDLYQEDDKNGCPGVAKVNFYGDGRVVYAIVLIKEAPGKVSSQLIMAQLNKVNQWELTTLLDLDDGCACPVVAEPPGEYRNVHGKRTLKSKGEVILHFQYESWAIVFAWTGEKIDQTHIKD